MAYSNEKVTFGAVIDNKGAAEPLTGNNAIAPMPSTTPFYDIPSAQPSLQSLPGKKRPAIAIYEADLEACQGSASQNPTPFGSNSALDLPPARPVASYATTHKQSFDGRTKECTMWPTKDALRDKAKAEKTRKRQTRWCGQPKIWWDGLTKKQRLLFKILIVFFVVGIATGLGIGISKAVNGGVFAGNGQSKSIANA